MSCFNLFNSLSTQLKTRYLAETQQENLSASENTSQYFLCAMQQRNQRSGTL